MAALDDILNIQRQAQQNKVLNVPPLNLSLSNQQGGSNSVTPTLEANTPAPTPPTPATPDLPKFTSYEDIIKAGVQNPELTEEDRQKEIKREKSRAAIAAIGDGVSSIANLVFATRGAVAPVAPKLSSINAQRYQQLRKDREAKSDQYQNALTSARMREKDFGYQQYRDSVSNKMQERSFDMQQKQMEKQDIRYNQQHQKEAERFEEEKRRAAVSERNDNKRLSLAASAQTNENEARKRQLDIDSAYKQSIADYRAQAAGIHKNSIALYDSESDKNVYIDKAKFVTMAPDVFNKMLADKEFLLKYSEGRAGSTDTQVRMLKQMNSTQIANFVRENWNKSNVARESIAALSTETIQKQNLFDEEKQDLFD